MNLVNLTINNKSISVPKGSTILEAARKLNIKIPTLCHLNMSEVNIEIYIIASPRFLSAILINVL